MSPSIPLTKMARQARIADLVAEQAIASQAQLRDLLAAEGIEVTQATLSRDLLELKATKVRTPQGKPMYALPVDGGVRRVEDASDAQLQRWCQDLLVACDCVSHMVIVRTPAGAAQLLGAAIDRAVLDGVVGTVGGDDTILLVCRDEEAAGTVHARLLGSLDQTPSSASAPKRKKNDSE